MMGRGVKVNPRRHDDQNVATSPEAMMNRSWVEGVASVVRADATSDAIRGIALEGWRKGGDLGGNRGGNRG